MRWGIGSGERAWRGEHRDGAGGGQAWGWHESVALGSGGPGASARSSRPSRFQLARGRAEMPREVRLLPHPGGRGRGLWPQEAVSVWASRQALQRMLGDSSKGKTETGELQGPRCGLRSICRWLDLSNSRGQRGSLPQTRRGLTLLSQLCRDPAVGQRGFKTAAKPGYETRLKPRRPATSVQVG